MSEAIKALERAKILIGLLTVEQVISAGDEFISASGLNPWCLNEGLAAGDEKISTAFINFAIQDLMNKTEVLHSD